MNLEKLVGQAVEYDEQSELTMGQRLSIPMVIVGILLVFWPRLRGGGETRG